MRPASWWLQLTDSAGQFVLRGECPWPTNRAGGAAKLAFHPPPATAGLDYRLSIIDHGATVTMTRLYRESGGVPLSVTRRMKWIVCGASTCGART
jgi:hypothetical protein